MAYLHMVLQFIFHLNDHLALFAAQYGLWIYLLLFSIIFCETGLVVTAIMPGDSLLFAAGAIAALGLLNLYWLFFLLVVAAFLGNVVNYWIGNRLGHLLFVKEDSLFFKKSYLTRTHQFYERYGALTIVIARFMPIIRTFAPFVAGMGDMNPLVFMAYNFVGAFLWVALLLGVSYWFGNVPIVKSNFSWVILTIIVLSVLPPVIGYLRMCFKRRAAAID